MPDIFLSYSREDQPMARCFAEALEREGFKVWWDQTLRSGENYDQVTEEALEQAGAVVVLWSKASVGSRWVRAEATLADRRGTLVPVMIEDCKRPIMFELKHTADLSRWKGDTNHPAWRAYVADVRRVVQKDAAPTDQPRATAGAAAIGGPSRRGMWLALAAVVLLVVGAGAFWKFRQPAAAKPAQDAALPAKESGPVTLAVLPFVNLSSDPEQEYFSDGLTEEILDQLAQNRDMRVTARTSSFVFKGKNEDLRVVGQKLGVRNILEGSVRKAGQQLKITAQLVDVADGTNRWSQSYERQLTDVFAVQEEIARAVAQALSITLDVGETSRARGGTNSVEAYDKYLRARSLDRSSVGRGTLEALQLYREAVDLDPMFLMAWSALYGDLATLLAFNYPGRSADARREMAQVLERLEELSPNSWQLLWFRAQQLMDQRQWLDAEAALSRAGAVRAEFEIGGDILYALKSRTGRFRELVPIMERARDADPLSLSTSFNMQWAYFLAGRTEDAQAEYVRSKSLEGDHTNPDILAMHRLLSMEQVDARAVSAQADPYLRSIPSGDQLFRSLLEQLKRGDRQAARTTLRRLFDDPGHQNSWDMASIAMFAGNLEDTDLALAAMRRAYVDMNAPQSQLIWMPYRSPVRRDPRFKQLVRDLGLVDYWRKSGNWGDLCKPAGTDDFECN